MPKVTVNEDVCKGCGLCVKYCPQSLIMICESELNGLGYRPAGFSDGDDNCKGCKICAEMCPDVAIEVYK